MPKKRNVVTEFHCSAALVLRSSDGFKMYGTRETDSTLHSAVLHFDREQARSIVKQIQKLLNA